MLIKELYIFICQYICDNYSLQLALTDTCVNSNLKSYYKPIIFEDYKQLNKYVKIDRFSVTDNEILMIKSKKITKLHFMSVSTINNYILHRGIYTKTPVYCVLLSSLPNTLTHISFGHEFNQMVDDLPNSVTHIKFGDNFNQCINNLPRSLLYLELAGMNFNQPIDLLPKTLKFLSLGFRFNKSVNNLPSKLVSLTLEHSFDGEIDMLPPSLKYLRICDNLKKKFDKLPKSVTHLHFIRTLFLHGPNEIIDLPDTIEYIMYDYDYGCHTIIDQIIIYSIGDNFRRSLSALNEETIITNIPKNLKCLLLCDGISSFFMMKRN